MTTAPGSGTIERLPSGRYRVRLRFANGRRRDSTLFDSHEDAARFRDAALAELADSAVASTGPVTLRAFGPGVLDERERDGVRSIASERSAWRRHVATAPFADRPLASITADVIEDWVDSLKKQRAHAPAAWRKASGGAPALTTRPLSRQMRQHALNLLRMILDAAVKSRRLKSNPATGIYITSRRGEPRASETFTILTVEEMALIRASADVTQEERDSLEVDWGSALRTGEKYRLRWEDVRLDGPRAELTVRSSWDGPPKNGLTRIVPLLPGAREALLRIRARHFAQGEEAHGLVFTTARGCPHPRGYDGGWADRVRAKGTVVPGIKTRAGSHATSPATAPRGTRWRAIC